MREHGGADNQRSRVCGPLPPPSSAGSSLLKFSSIFPVAFEDRSKPSQEIGGELSSLGETPSKGRGGRGRGRGRGSRGRGKSGQNQDDSIADSTSTLHNFSIPGHSNKRGSSVRANTGGRGRQKASSREKVSLEHEINAPVHPAAPLATAVGGLNNIVGGLSFPEHGRSSDLFKSTQAIEHVLGLRSVDLSTVCGALPPTQCMPGLNTGVCGSSPLYVEGQSQQGAVSHHSIGTAEDAIKTASIGMSTSRGRGGRGRGGRGRGRSGAGDDHINVVLPSDETSKALKGKGAAQQGKGKKFSHRGGIPNSESSDPTCTTEASVEGKDFSFAKLSSPPGLINIETHHEDAHSLDVRVSDILADGGSLHSPQHTAGLVPNDLPVEEQSRLGDHEAPSPSLSPSLQGGNLQEELAEFLMPAGADSGREVQACKSARKRTKSRKVLENENLWRELTTASKVVDSTVDPMVKNLSSVDHSQAQSARNAEELNSELDKQEFFLPKEFATSNDGDNLPASVAECRVKESTQGTAKRRKGQGLKERARFRRPSPQDQHDISRCLHQASDIDMLAAEHSSYSKCATDRASTHCEDGFSNYDSIEVVEDWQSYCPYAPSSHNLVHVYEDGGPAITSLPIFRSSRVSPCTDKIWPDYYDLVLNAGGSIWALDWCPHMIQKSDSRRQFLAVGAHPHDSPIHRLGEQVQGKGLIQLWAFDLPFLSQAQASWHYHQLNRQGVGKQKARAAGRARGRPKKLTSEDDESRELLVGDVAEGSCGFDKSPTLFLEEKRLDVGAGMDVEGGKVETSVPALTSSLATEESGLPQMVLGFAHDAGLVWDAKWQPVNAICGGGSGRLGYLAAVFGDSSMQVFDVPSPSLLGKSKSSGGDTSAPVVVKMKPVFRCSGLSSGGQKSLPLTIEWSPSPPHDLLLVGCHDGTVALWKFNPTGFSDHDTRPLTCFVADTAPIRALAFAPDGTDVESRNVIVTGGHSGRLLFWDLRDPFYPLWDLSLSKGGCILSIDWLLFPRGIVLSMDDGTIKTLSLDVSLCDLPFTGTPPPKSLSQGMHTTFASDYAVWSVHVSRASGMAVYGGEDGSVVHCQLTEKYFVNDRARAREPHFLCCKVIEESGSGVLSLESINSDAPLQVKNQRADSKQVPLTKAFSRRASGNMFEEEDHPKKKSGRQSAKKRQFSLLEGKDTDDEDFFPDEVDPLALVPYDPNMSSKPKTKSRSLSTTVGKDNTKNRKVMTPCSNSGRDSSALPDAGGLAAPSKAVAVHRVRWNQNRGCESLVCFGGAAGIVRCQLIMPRGL
ncbi:hypothetical protein GOP47_0029035 [Adiantum capillus-veneris]|nr:hypothetical protein GOP47_0029035 [Adiantum capillus-veneris]